MTDSEDDQREPDEVADRSEAISADEAPSEDELLESDEDRESGDASSEEDDSQEFTIDDLGAAYAEAMAEAGLLPEAEDSDDEDADTSESSEHEDSEEAEVGPAEQHAPPTPEGVVEAALFLGHPENKPLSGRELARVMRDVSPKEVEKIVADLNASYEELEHTMRIISEDGGYRMVLADDMESIRRVFYGKVREARLSQPAIEILSLVAYQPGISSQELAKQRGKDCGPLLNQLVRRDLLQMTRERVEGISRITQTYRPTDRFLNLFGLSSLDDLPQVDEDVESI